MSNLVATDSSRPALLGQYAGFVTRLIAWTIDQLIVAIVITGAVAATTFLLQAFHINELLARWLGLGDVTTTITVVVGVVTAVLVPLVYYIGFWMLAGQTIGKWIMGVRIVRTNGQRLGFGASLLRYIGYVVSAILLLGYLWILIDDRRQGFHDKLARTFVVYSWPEVAPVRPVLDRLRSIRLQQ